MADLGDYLGNAAIGNFVVELGAFEAFDAFGAQVFLLGFRGLLVDGVFDVADDFFAGGDAVLDRGGFLRLVELFIQHHGAAHEAGDEVVGLGDVGRDDDGCDDDRIGDAFVGFGLSLG